MIEPLGLGSMAQGLGVAVLHFLWQGTLVGLIAWLILGILGQNASRTRYWVCCGAMLLSVLLFVATLFTTVAASTGTPTTP
ncbi:MAG: hypothetical protein HRU13_00495, partial [Phycisphaerales bacterium]|nr:hypothetical protein [Phycisphaerales bacterium]